MNVRTTRRTAIATLAGAAAAATLAPTASLAAMSGAAGIVAGGTLEGANGTITFSAFGSRITLDDVDEPVLFCALTWHDPAGLDGGPLTIDFASAASYGPTDVDTERLMTGTVTINGDAEAPFALWMVDGGVVGEGGDTVHLAVGDVALVDGTPVAGGDAGVISYDVEGELASGNIQIIALPEAM